MSNNRFVPTKLGSIINEVALPIVSHKEGRYFSGGTAVIVSSYLAITAKHVVMADIEFHERKKLQISGKDQNLDLGHQTQVAQIYEGGKKAALWDITKMWLSPHTDIAFLRLMPHNEDALNYKWRTPRLNLYPPKPGEKIVAFGYHTTKISADGTWEMNPTTTTGKVLDVYPISRDKVILNYPCFSTTARTENHMSGGPILNENMEICGLISGGFGEEKPSFGISLWPMMGTVMDMERPDRKPPGLYPVLEIAQNGWMRARNWEKISLKETSKNKYSIGLFSDK